MGKCRFCGEQAGFLRKLHKECKLKNDEKIRKHVEATIQIKSTIENAGVKGCDLSDLENEINEFSETYNLDEYAIKETIISGWEHAVERAFDDGILTDEEESNLIKIAEHFSLSRAELDRNELFTKIVKGAVLRDVMNGVIPDRMSFDGNLPFNFQKTEKIIWLFQDVDYYEQKKRTQYVGGSKGFSIRIAKGVYYRTGAFKGERVETHETIHADTGLLGVTNKHIYFSGGVKNFRIRHDKIVSFEPFSDGIGLQRDAATAKPQSFVTNDGWFTYNLISNVAQL